MSRGQVVVAVLALKLALLCALLACGKQPAGPHCEPIADSLIVKDSGAVVIIELCR